MENFLHQLEPLLRRRISRNVFLRVCLGWILALFSMDRFVSLAFAETASAEPRRPRNIDTRHDLVAVKGADPYRNTVAAIEALGGMELFVRKGDVVVVKPNIGWDRTPEQAANTDPAVVAALVELCYRCGARRVNVFDVTCNDQRRCYENSGIQSAAKEKGAQVYFPDNWNVVKAHFPYASQMEGWSLLRDAVVCDTFINVPVLKHHGLTGLTLSMKNLMGVCTGIRGMIHVDIGKKLVDLVDFIRPELTVIDATRFLSRNGPSGGNIDDVVRMDTVLASKDPVLADAYASTLVGRDPLSITYIKEAAERKLGQSDIARSKVSTLQI
ncbi:MAG: DUF362 domain-containing protein [Candidatus Omnitrophica bacterium]|nr:DUF362 domain-containing protein [Candidatus Omnitrophota bacterium]